MRLRPSSTFLLLPLLLLGISGAPTASATTVFARTPTNAVITLNVDASDSIENVKAKIQDHSGLLPMFQTISFAAQTLEDGRTLADYNIQNQATLRLALTAGTGSFSALDFSGSETFNIGFVNDANGGVSATAYSFTSPGTWNLASVSTVAPIAINLFSLAATASTTNFYNEVSNFDPAKSQSWTILSANGVTGFDAAKFTVNTTHFAGTVSPDWFSVSLTDNRLTLNFTPVPEPSTTVAFALGLALCGGYQFLRRRSRRG